MSIYILFPWLIQSKFVSGHVYEMRAQMSSGRAESLLEHVVPTSTSKNGASDDVYDMTGYFLFLPTIVATQAWSWSYLPTIEPMVVLLIFVSDKDA